MDIIFIKGVSLLRAINAWLDRFAYKHRGFGIPNLINYLLVGNVVVYLLDMFSGGAATALLALDFGSAIMGLQFWRLVTFVFVPDASQPIWFFLSLLFYYFMGTRMEQEWGTAKFNLFYLVGAVLTFLASIVTFFWSGGAMSYGITLSAVHSTLFLGYATLFPDDWFRIYFIIPVKAKWLALFYVFTSVWGIVGMNRAFLPLLLPILLPSLIASWLNYALFFWPEVTAFVRRILGMTRHQTSQQTVNFKAAANKAREQKGYLHKCAVCGKTDTDFPDEEFRYCSKCNGYYCYCKEHIGSHVHIE